MIELDHFSRVLLQPEPTTRPHVDTVAANGLRLRDELTRARGRMETAGTEGRVIPERVQLRQSVGNRGLCFTFDDASRRPGPEAWSPRGLLCFDSFTAARVVPKACATLAVDWPS